MVIVLLPEIGWQASIALFSEFERRMHRSVLSIVGGIDPLKSIVIPSADAASCHSDKMASAI